MVETQTTTRRYNYRVPDTPRLRHQRIWVVVVVFELPSRVALGVVVVVFELPSRVALLPVVAVAVAVAVVVVFELPSRVVLGGVAVVFKNNLT